MSSMCGNCYAQVTGRVQCTSCNVPLHKDCTSTGRCDACELNTAKEVNRSMDVVLPDAIRRSHIEQYKSCPYSLYLDLKNGDIKHNNEGEDDNEGSIYAILGRDLHELFDKASNDLGYSIGTMLADFQAKWYNYTPELFESGEFKEKMYERAITCISAFYGVLNTLPHVPHITEENIVFSIDEHLPNVSITMDRIDMINGELEMLDWKTGKVMVGKKLTTDLQAPLYIYAVKQKYNLPIRKFTFYYLNEGKTRVFERINDDQYMCTVKKNEYVVSLTETIREVKSLFSRMKNGDFNIPLDTKSMFFTCKMCAHQAKGLCRGADEESWHVNFNQGVS